VYTWLERLDEDEELEEECPQCFRKDADGEEGEYELDACHPLPMLGLSAPVESVTDKDNEPADCTWIHATIGKYTSYVLHFMHPTSDPGEASKAIKSGRYN
jgi:hypothetical protein